MDTAKLFDTKWEMVGNRIHSTGDDNKRKTIAIITNMSAFGNDTDEAKLMVNAPELTLALQAAHYAMSKYAAKDCAREIKTAKKALIKAIGHI